MGEQKYKLEDTLFAHMKGTEQIDDTLCLGIKL